AEDGIRDFHVTGVQTCALPICDAMERAAGGVATNRVDAHVRAQPVGHLFQVGGDVVDLAEVHRLGVGELPRELQAVVLAVDHDQIGRASCREMEDVGAAAGGGK